MLLLLPASSRPLLGLAVGAATSRPLSLLSFSWISVPSLTADAQFGDDLRAVFGSWDERVGSHQ